MLRAYNPEFDDIDDDLRREDIEARRDRVHCKCGNPDMPGQCPGWRNCPMHGEVSDGD